MGSCGFWFGGDLCLGWIAGVLLRKWSLGTFKKMKHVPICHFQKFAEATPKSPPQKMEKKKREKEKTQSLLLFEKRSFSNTNALSAN